MYITHIYIERDNVMRHINMAEVMLLRSIDSTGTNIPACLLNDLCTNLVNIPQIHVSVHDFKKINLKQALRINKTSLNKSIYRTSLSQSMIFKYVSMMLQRIVRSKARKKGL